MLGIPVDVYPNYLEEVIKRLSSSSETSSGGHVITLNTEMVMLARQNALLAEVIQHADLVIPDGAGVVLYGRFAGQPLLRCPGIDLAEQMLSLAARCGYRVFFLGGAPWVADAAALRWQEILPELVIAGVAHGYFEAAEEAGLLEEIGRLQPDMIFVALGVPRQELWIHEHRVICPRAIWMGVGGSFDVWSGQKSRAPGWMGRANLEWLFRLYQEPWRWRRMLVLPQFVWCALKEGL